jgi:hypothetical protein
LPTDGVSGDLGCDRRARGSKGKEGAERHRGGQTRRRTRSLHHGPLVFKKFAIEFLADTDDIKSIYPNRILSRRLDLAAISSPTPP